MTVTNTLEQIFSPNALLTAWRKIKSKGAGAGIDGISLIDFESELDSNLKELSTQIKEETYVPDPYERFFIKKSGAGYRPISALTIRDKIIQNCVALFYEEKLNKIFLDTNYAYRKNKGHNKAINRINDFIMRGFLYAALIDIDNFFDTIDRAKLFNKCKIYFNEPYILKLLEMWIMIGVVYNNKYIESSKGIAQGGVISPILSNLYLHDFDLALSQKNIFNVRYADNVLLLAKSKEEINNVVQYAAKYLDENLALYLNKDIKICPVNDGFSFCGIYFKDKMRRIDPAKFDSLKDKLKNIIISIPIDNLPEKLNEHFSGIERYYLPFDTQDQIQILQEIVIKNLTDKMNKLQNFSFAAKRIILKRINFFSWQSITERNKIISTILNPSKEETTINNSFASSESRKAVYNKKKKYQKIWYENLDLVISQKFSVIGKSNDSIVIRREGKVLNQINAKKIKNIIISARSCSVSSDAVELCSSVNLRIDFFDLLGKPYASIIPAASPIQSIMNDQFVALSSKKGKPIISELIEAKIKNQISVIKYFIKNKKELQTAFQERIQRMEDIVKLMNSIPPDTDIELFRSKILGYEGSAAVDYWSLFKNLIPPKYEFENREHKAADNIVNIMLNYGYGILYNRILTAITVAGLNPNISYLHKEQKNKPTLVFDLIEPFRAPAVDRTVIAVLNKHSNLALDKNILSNKTKSVLSQKLLLRMNTEFTYRSKTTSINNLMIEQAAGLVDYLQDKSTKFKPYISKW